MSRRVKDYFEQVSSEWDSLRKGLYGEEVRKAVLKAAQIGPEDTVLDVGAGTGFLTEEASRIAGKVIALDFSKSMTEEAVFKLEAANVEFKIGSVERIPIADSSVDAVVGNMILHHCPKPEAAIKEMVRVLRPGGRLALSDMQEHSHEWLRTEKADLWLGFKMIEVERMLEQAGMEEVRVENLGACCSTLLESEPVEIPMFLARARKPKLVSVRKVFRTSS